MADAVKSVKCIGDALEVVREIGKLVKKSSQRDTKLERSGQKLKMTHVHDLCPTRWTVRGEALAATLNNYSELIDLWDWSLTIPIDTEMKTRIRGVQAMMLVRRKTFETN